MSESDFLGRWSRRKADARGGLRKKEPEQAERTEPVHKPGRMRTEPPAPKTPPASAEAPEGEGGGEVRQAALREDDARNEPAARAKQETSPEERKAPAEADAAAEPENFDEFDFESLNYESDYTRFMKGDVPEAVRKRALRMLWGSNPILANVDGLNDYDEDFTDAALAVKGLLKSAYRPGKGYLTDEEVEASYSDEAREAGPKLTEEDAEKVAATETEAEGTEAETAGEAGEEEDREEGTAPKAAETKSAAEGSGEDSDAEGNDDDEAQKPAKPDETA